MYTSAIVWLYITLECAWAVEYEPLPTTAARPSLSRDTSNELIWVCPPHSDTCMGVTSPFARYIRRSIWFERKAIIITAIYSNTSAIFTNISITFPPLSTAVHSPATRCTLDRKSVV